MCFGSLFFDFGIFLWLPFRSDVSCLLAATPPHPLRPPRPTLCANSTEMLSNTHSDYATNIYMYTQSVKISKREIKFVRIVANRRSSRRRWLLLCRCRSATLLVRSALFAVRPTRRRAHQTHRTLVNNNNSAGVHLICGIMANGTEEIVIWLVWRCSLPFFAQFRLLLCVFSHSSQFVSAR